MAEIIKSERTQLAHIIGFIGAEVSISLNHVRSIASEPVTRQAVTTPNADSLRTLQSSFLTLARRNPFYQQVRWIDEAGMERIRIERDQNEPYVVDSGDLQNKRHRYYFAAANALAVGDLYISRLDLNVERGQIEMPPQPMLRIATPVEDKEGHRRGIVVVNVSEKPMFDVVHEIARENGNADYLVLNREGYRLSGTPRGERSSHRLFRGVSFAKSYPDIWKKIGESSSGTLESAHGMWTWQTLSTAETVRSIAQALSRNEAVAPELHADAASLTFVAQKPVTALLSMRRDIRMPVMIGAIVVLIVFGLSLYLYLRSSVRERLSELNVTAAAARAADMQRLKELEERFRRLFDASSIGLMVVGAEGDIELSNPAAESMFGYQKGELEGHSVDSLLLQGQREGHARLREGFMQAPETRKMGVGRKLEAVTKDGRNIPVEVGLSPYSDRGRQLVLASVIDLSGRELPANGLDG
ncbi:MAG: PAS domain S-box protein [Chromatiaceae bacterium]|nr:PAS domain S-box protein [Chromatiaceae bacterium]